MVGRKCYNFNYLRKTPPYTIQPSQPAPICAGQHHGHKMSHTKHVQ